MSDLPPKRPGVSDSRPVGFETASAPKGTALKVRRIGSSLGVVLPREVLAKLRASEGDQLIATEAPGGGIRLSLGDADDAALMALAEGIMRKRRKVLKALAE